MAIKLKDYWFGVFLGLMVLCFLAFVAIVAIAPHNDARLRGFAPCTLKLAQELSVYEEKPRIQSVLAAVGRSYVCYAGIMWQSAKDWAKGKEPTPWSGYLFEPLTDVMPEEEAEGFSEELIKANLLDDTEDKEEFYFMEEKIKENRNEQE